MEDKALARNRIVRSLSLWTLLTFILFEILIAIAGMIVPRGTGMHYIERDWHGLFYANMITAGILLAIILIPKPLNFTNSGVSFQLLGKLMCIIFVLTFLHSFCFPGIFISLPWYASSAIVMFLIIVLLLLSRPRKLAYVTGIRDSGNECITLSLKDIEIIVFRVIGIVAIIVLVIARLSYFVFPPTSRYDIIVRSLDPFDLIQLILCIICFLGINRINTKTADIPATLKGYISLLCKITAFYILCFIMIEDLRRIRYSTDQYIRPIIFSVLIILLLFLSPKLLKNIPLKTDSLTNFTLTRVTLIYISVFFIASHTVDFYNLAFDYKFYDDIWSFYYVYLMISIVTIIFSGFIARLAVKNLPRTKIPE